MKSLLAAWFVLTLVFSGGCVAPAAPEDPNQTVWSLEPDKDTREGVVLQKGETRESVIARLGTPRRKDRPKADPAVELLRYRRTVYGPVVQQSVSTVRGPMVIQKPTFYVDEIAITMRDGLLEKVAVERRVEEDYRGMPRLH